MVLSHHMASHCTAVGIQVHVWALSGGCVSAHVLGLLCVGKFM